MPKSTDPDVQLLQAAADPIRLRMLRQLALGDAVCACDFVADATVTQPTISHHLRVLRESGWVTTERRGTWIWYSLRPEAAQRFARLAGFMSPAGDADTATGSRRLPVIDVSDRARAQVVG
jgi:ArsR family transcriptional regulator, arsenate/arsenite/antimonite-responsive transcriptional repressor